MNLLILLCLISLSLAQDCGVSITSSKTNKIHFPWLAEMYSTVNRTKAGDPQHLCGSSIITRLFTLTAAHCIQEKYSSYRRSPNEIFLMANVLDLKDFNDSLKIEIQKIFTHTSWNPAVEMYDGDIALLKFKEILTFNEKISPICMWNGNDDMKSFATGKIITFVALEEDDPGYYNYRDDELHNYPKEYTMPIRNSCTETQKRFKSIASNSSFCAGGLNSGACLEIGSSGSSMAVELNHTYYLRGIVSATFIDFAGCDNYTFTLFTNVSKYQKWIDEIIQF